MNDHTKSVILHRENCLNLIFAQHQRYAMCISLRPSDAYGDHVVNAPSQWEMTSSLFGWATSSLIGWAHIQNNPCAYIYIYVYVYIYASVHWVITGSGNCLTPVHRQALTWTNTTIFPIEPLETYFSEILIKMWTFQEDAFKNIVYEMAAIFLWPQCALICCQERGSSWSKHWLGMLGRYLKTVLISLL